MLTYLYSLGLQCFDNYGERLVSGAIFSYDLGTTSNKVTYQDVYGLVPNTNPVILDHAGRASVYLNGSYTLRLVDKNGVDIETIDVRGSSQDSLSTTAVGSWAMNEVIVVENYAALRAINSPYAIVWCQGREFQGDFGQGWFYLDIGSTEADDSGIVLQPQTTGRYIRYNVQKVNPQWFGLTYDTILSQAVYLSAACESSLRFAKPVYINGNIYLNSNFSTSAQTEFSDISKLVSTLPISASFYSEVIGAKDVFGNTVQPKFYANTEVKYSWMGADNVEGKVQKLLKCTSEECIINFDEDISTTESIIIPNNFTFRSNRNIYFNTDNPMDLTIPKIETVYPNTIRFKSFSTVGTMTIADEINPEFFSGIGFGADDTIPVQAALRSGKVFLTNSYVSSGAHITSEPINIRSNDIKKSTMPTLTLSSLSFTTLLLTNVSINSTLNGNVLNGNNVRMVCDGTVNYVTLNDVEYISGKLNTQEAELESVVYSGSSVPCSKITKLTNSQFSNCLMTGSDKIEGVISNVIITPVSANSIILKDSIVQNLYYNDSSDTFKPVLVLSGDNKISNSNFYAKNYKNLCQGNSSSATFNSCSFSNNITVSEASNYYALNGCEGGSLEINGKRDSIVYRTKIFTSGTLTDDLGNWYFKNSGEIDDLDVIDASLETDRIVFNQPYYFDTVYSPNSVINGNSADTDKVYTYTYVPGFSSTFDKFIRFGGRLRVTTKNTGNSYFKICVGSPEYRLTKDGVTVGLTTSAQSFWENQTHKLLHETGILSNNSSNDITTEFSYEINQQSFRPVLEDLLVPTGYPILLTDHLGIRADVLNSSATTNFYTNAEVYFVGFVDAGTEVRIDWIAEIPKNDLVSETYFKKTSATSDTYLYTDTENYIGIPYISSGVNNISDKWIFNTSYSSFGNTVLMHGKNPTKMTSANSLSAGNYQLIRNGYLVLYDYWKWMKNCYSNRLDTLIPNLLENDLEIRLDNIVDKDNLSNFPETLVKPISAVRFYKSNNSLT